MRAEDRIAAEHLFFRPEIRWLLDHVPGARKGAEAGEVLFGTMDSWIAWNLTGGAQGGMHITDVTNASRTQMMNLETSATGIRTFWTCSTFPALACRKFAPPAK